MEFPLTDLVTLEPEANSDSDDLNMALARFDSELDKAVECERFALFCRVLERGFALHTGSSHRLAMHYLLEDVKELRQLPRIRPTSAESYQLPESWLIESPYYLFFDPSMECHFPQLATYEPADHSFIPVTYDAMQQVELMHSSLPLLVAKLGGLRGLHYIKDIACIRLYEIDLAKVFEANADLAEMLRGSLVEKFSAHTQASKEWLSANYAEQIAQKYLTPD